jgi:hypothetical protein
MNPNYLDKYSKYVNKYNNLVNEISGGTIRTSGAWGILNGLTPADGVVGSVATNALVSNGGFNVGVAFIGSLSNDPGRIRILCGKERRWNAGALAYEDVLSTFGGRIEVGETVLTGLIRETIEEIFNFIPSAAIIGNLTRYLTTTGLNSYKIIRMGGGANNYVYIFDVSTLGNFIEEISRSGNHVFDAYFLRGSFTNNASVPSFNQANFVLGGRHVTVNLPVFMRNRPIPVANPGGGLNEIRNIGFPNIRDLAAGVLAAPHQYNFFNETTRRGVAGVRDLLRARGVLRELLNTPAIRRFR